MKYGVIIHGGAWDIPDDAVLDHLQGVQEACDTASKSLREGKSSLDAVEAAISLMEHNPTFDAGRGSFVNQIGEVEMDAIIATEDFHFGSVCAVTNIANPIQLARLVMEKTNHHILVGRGANLFALEHGFKEVSPESLLIGRELERYYQIKGKKDFHPKDTFHRKPNGMGTVGALCIDLTGKIAAGVSTGGTPYKRVGRVGDTPIWGAGAYIDAHIGAVATGYGEDIIKVLLTKKAVEYAKREESLSSAAFKAIQDLEQISGLGGVIMLNEQEFGIDFNTPRMAFAFQVESNSMQVGINPEDRNRFKIHR